MPDNIRIHFLDIRQSELSHLFEAGIIERIIAIDSDSSLKLTDIFLRIIKTLKSESDSWLLGFLGSMSTDRLLAVLSFINTWPYGYRYYLHSVKKDRADDPPVYAELSLLASHPAITKMLKTPIQIGFDLFLAAWFLPSHMEDVELAQPKFIGGRFQLPHYCAIGICSNFDFDTLYIICRNEEILLRLETSLANTEGPITSGA